MQVSGQEQVKNFQSYFPCQEQVKNVQSDFPCQEQVKNFQSYFPCQEQVKNIQSDFPPERQEEGRAQQGHQGEQGGKRLLEHKSLAPLMRGTWNRRTSDKFKC